MAPRRRALALVGVAALGAAAPAHAAGTAPGDDGVAARIASLPGGGSDDWDVAVRAELLAFDDDASGSLDRPLEVARVPCAVWLAVDAGVRIGFGIGVFTVYGFAPDKIWIGEALGLEAPMRGLAAAALTTCGLGPEDPAELPPGRAIDVPQLLGRLPAGGSTAWDLGVRTVLLHHYDHDGSGLVDTDTEVADVPCAVWHALDDGVRRGWPAGLYVTYGLDGSLMWIADALGLGEAARPAVIDALRTCEVPDTRRASVLPDDAGVIARVVLQLPEAGGGPWSEVVRRSLLHAFDGSDNGLLDDRAELASVPCFLWEALDAAVRHDLGQGLLDAYGFAEDGVWRGYALGVPGAARAVAADVVGACLAVDPAADGPPVADAVEEPADAPGALPAVLAPFDADGSGRLDSRREARAVTCTAWTMLDAQTRVRRGVGAIGWYGLQAGPAWAGDAAGLSDDVAGVVSRRARRCLAR